MSRYKPYPAYKESGVAWLGRVPAHWKVVRMRYAATLNPPVRNNLLEAPEQEVSFLAMESIGEDGSLNLEHSRPVADVRNGYSYFEDGDVAFAKVTPCFENGKGALMRGLRRAAGFGTTELTVLRPKPAVADASYINYIVQDSSFRAFGAGAMTGAGGLKRVPDEFTRNFLVSLPDLNEQRAIANQLDRETARIDALIEKKTRFIELLREKRQALITHAVTKGLDPDAKMKDSGVEWLGKVPEQWVAMRVAAMYREVVRPGESDLPVLSISIHSGISDDELSAGERDRKVSLIEDREKYKRVCPGDLAYNMMRAWQGGFGAVAVDGLVSPAYVVAEPKIEIVTEYIELLLRTPMAVEEMRRFSRGIADFRMRLYWEAFRDVVLLSPPIEEQRAIVDRVKQEGARIDALAKKTELSITLLTERRSALITAAVTGQIDLRESA